MMPPAIPPPVPDLSMHRSSGTAQPPPVPTGKPPRRRASYGRRPRGSVRGYEAAATDRLLNDWLTSDQEVNSAWSGSAARMRTRARNMEQNHDLTGRFLQLMEMNVVGHRGIRYQANTLNAKGKPDKTANGELEAAWADWGRRENCTVDGRFSWVRVLKMALRRFFVDGEAFVRIHRGFPNTWGFALEPLEAEMIDEHLNRKRSQNENEIRFGVEMDKYRRPIAYHVKVEESRTSQYGAKTERVAAEDMIHLYLPELPRQVRGFTWMARTMRGANMLHGFQYAAVVAARHSAEKLGFLKPGEDYGGDGEEDDGSIIVPSGAGEFEILPDDIEPVPFESEWPKAEYSQYTKDLKRDQAAGLGVSYVSLASDLTGVNYSSIRQGEIEQRDLYRVFQFWLIDEACERVKNEWLTMSLIMGAIGKLPLSRIEKFRPARWQPRGWQWVDPTKEVTAQRKALQLGLTSPSQIVGETTGGDLEEVYQQINRDQELAAEYGVQVILADVVGGTAGDVSGSPPEDKEGEDEEDDDD